MPMLIGATLMLQGVAAATPTVAQVEASPSAGAGELVLAGKEHGEIASVAQVEQPGPHIPGLVELDLVEAARQQGHACVRRRWRAKFRHNPGEAAGEARLDDAYAVWEVALPGGGGCASASFAHLNPGTSVETAVVALKELRRIVARPAGVEIVCSSSLDPALCADKRTTIARVAAAPAWLISGGSGVVRLLLGDRGQAPIAIELDGVRPDRIMVSREVPAPF